MHVDSMTMKLPVKMTDDEVKARAHEAAELVLELDLAKADEADRKKAWKAAHESKERYLRDLSESVRTRTEQRLVEVDEVPCVGRATMEVYRRDTGELVLSRPMTEAEMRSAAQANLWDSPKAAARADEAQR